MSQIMAAWLIFFAGMCFGLLVSYIGDRLNERQPESRFNGRNGNGYQPFDSDPSRALKAPPGAE